MALRMLVPQDGSAASEGVLPWVARLATALRGEVTLLRVLPLAAEPTGTEPGETSATDSGVQQARSRLEALVSDAHLAGTTRTAVERGPVGDVIAACSAEHDLVVAVGDVRWTAEGSVSGRLLAEVILRSTAPVLALSSAFGERPGRVPRQILLAVDADGSHVALMPHVASLARLLQLEVTLFSSVPLGRGRQELTAAAARLQALRSDLRHAGVAVRTVSREGNPGAAIVEYASEKSIDVIAIGAGRSQPAGRLGAAAEYVLMHSEKPVLALAARPREPGEGLRETEAPVARASAA